jgi:hypothetical protein
LDCRADNLSEKFNKIAELARIWGKCQKTRFCALRIAGILMAITGIVAACF